MSAAREYAIVVFGATGFTGGKTAEYLARHASTLRWAIAGRDQVKLDAVKARLVAIDPRNAAVGTLVARVDDESSLQRMAAATSVLVTTVGPFIDYGEPVVRACVEARTDYVDSTGEPFFFQLLHARYSERARERGVRLVPSCGFDAIPADLGALFTVRQLPRGCPIQLAGYMSWKAVFSGGTERSALKSVVPPSEPIVAPAFTPRAGRKVAIRTERPRKHPLLGAWVSPLETVDSAIVARSAASLDDYGPDFSYAHNVQHASFGHMLAAFALFGTAGFFARYALPRDVFLKLAKQAGSGPTQAQMDESWFKLRFIAECGGTRVLTEVAGGDPGYGETSKMLAEAGMCLALERDTLPQRAGVLTSAEAMGDALLARLQRAGLSFRVV
ncbi:MAG: saccharopine dehydrogenase NADP-binding domain-containing protein [Polyangiales bacterium]